MISSALKDTLLIGEKLPPPFEPKNLKTKMDWSLQESSVKQLICCTRCVLQVFIWYINRHLRRWTREFLIQDKNLNKCLGGGRYDH